MFNNEILKMQARDEGEVELEVLRHVIHIEGRQN